MMEDGKQMTLRDLFGHMRIRIDRPTGQVVISDILNPSVPHLELWTYGDNRSDPINLEPPYEIAFLFYEDNVMGYVDNYRSLIITANPTRHPTNPNIHGFTVVFFCEGAYPKWVCYDNKLIHHYDPTVPAQKYGIFATWDLPLKGPCPF